ncbi:DinB family protein [Dyadobacter sp. CY345]|uniref:DinB family protein n=1 Tax=Dyadobacter sp. CY345 TaxID=2909335 RepID=UPI001F1CB966|nr:DinB family protein [Dyadobacter sp. CY345]MCF2447290.1 DinB family protein [Dyadobacter sp. CY345]
MKIIGRPKLEDAPHWYPYFLNLAPGNNLIEALENNKSQMLDIIASVPASLENFAYAENKWTVKQVFIHLADDERYYAYKAFCYSRQINVLLEVPQGQEYNKDFNAQNRTLEDIAEELLSIRNATITLFKGMTNEMLDFKGFTREVPYTARSLGWMAVGHNIHHCNLLKDRYLLQ